MNYATIIKQLQDSILSAQQALEELQCLDEQSSADIFITRQEAADLLCKGLRQMDRDCKRYGIRRKRCNNGVRISKRDILIHLGIIAGSLDYDDFNEFEQIFARGISV